MVRVGSLEIEVLIARGYLDSRLRHERKAIQNAADALLNDVLLEGIV